MVKRQKCSMLVAGCLWCVVKKGIAALFFTTDNEQLTNWVLT
jgi:hypothetical protein